VAAPALFENDSIRAIELSSADIPALQAFYEDNDDYFLAVNGGPPASDEAHKSIHEPLPAGFTYTKKWVIGWFDDAGAMLAMASVVSDLLAPRVWHVGLFIADRRLRGKGFGKASYAALEAWAIANGAAWIRLGVVEGNARAERFWRSLGFTEIRRREGVEMGKRINTVSVMMRPLEGGTRDAYLALVARDRPESA
jgi:ribosomal protein S18 acetylase RimI-like enzyme